VTSCR